MDVSVRTGATKAPRDLSLVSLSLESVHGERVLLLMEVAAREKEAHTIERECEAVVKHALLDAEGDAAVRLDSTLKELNGLLKGMLVSGAVHDIHVVISILDEQDMLHVSHAGRAEAYLIRKGSASQITEYAAGRPTPGFIHIASGQLEESDLVIFSTQRLLRTLTPAQLARLTAGKDDAMESIIRALEAEQEHAAIATLVTPGSMRANREREREEEEDYVPPSRIRQGERGPILSRRQRMQAGSIAARFPKLPSGFSFDAVKSAFLRMSSFASSPKTRGKAASGAKAAQHAAVSFWSNAQGAFQTFLADLSHPQRKKRAHLLLLASAVAAVIIIWAIVHLFTSSQRSKTRAELETLVTQINSDIQLAENRPDADSANAILERAEEKAKQIMDNESGLFRTEANELLGRIRAKREEINNIIRLTPRVAANLAANNPDINAAGLIGLGNGEFVAYDKQDAYRVLLNSVEPPSRVSEDVLIVDGANFPRFQSQVFLMNGNSVVERQGGQAVSMKTDDAKGWVNGSSVDAYLRFLYVLSPENKQIYKYERLNNRYGVPVEYNVNGDLTGAVDMSIDGNVYILKENGEKRSIVKLFRGEAQPFVIRNAPADILDSATKIFKVTERNMYILDPKGRRIVIVSDGGATGESTYVKQYVLEGEQIRDLKDLYVDEDESQLYVMDDKRIYVIEIRAGQGE